MSQIDYVFPGRKLFPIVQPSDIPLAIEAFKFFEDEISYGSFCFNLIRVAQSKGPNFVKALPTKLRKTAGIKRENAPEMSERRDSVKKKPSRFKEHFDEDLFE